jgi:hypothetical protein
MQNAIPHCIGLGQFQVRVFDRKLWPRLTDPSASLAYAGKAPANRITSQRACEKSRLVETCDVAADAISPKNNIGEEPVKLRIPIKCHNGRMSDAAWAAACA